MAIFDPKIAAVRNLGSAKFIRSTFLQLASRPLLSGEVSDEA